MPKFETVEEYRAKSEAILKNPTDQSVVGTNLADITEGVIDLAARLETTTKEMGELKAYNERLIHSNAELAMQVGYATPNTPPNTPPGTQAEEKPIDVKDFMNGKGRLK